MLIARHDDDDFIIYINIYFAQSAGAVEYTDPPPTSVLNMTLNSLMVRSQ